MQSTDELATEPELGKPQNLGHLEKDGSDIIEVEAFIIKVAVNNVTNTNGELK